MPVTRRQAAMLAETSIDKGQGKSRQRNQNSSSVEMHTPLDENLDSDFIFPHTPLRVPSMDMSDERVELSDEQRSQLLYADRGNIALLMFLYVLQGIPLGLSGSIPMILQGHHVSYADQAIFSFVFWPFSLKLLWAPFVDAIYLRSVGRRKSWLVPTQYFLGIFLVVLSYSVDALLGQSTDGSPTVSIYFLTALFFALNFLAATQDIAVDGWALTMLKRENVGWASTCNSVGQTAGYFLGNVLFLALESADFCNKYLRSSERARPTGVVTLSSFMYFWGLVFLVSTTLLFIFKREKPEPSSRSQDSILDTYWQLLSVVKLKPIQTYIVMTMTCKIAFSTADGVSGLKLIEAGMRKDTLALMAVPMIPLQIILPLAISRLTSGPKPMLFWLRAYPYRLAMGIIFALDIVLATKVGRSVGDHSEFPYWFYAFILVAYALHQVTLYSMFVAVMAFHAKISDPSIGGTYMTLLNTVSNLGSNWPVTVSLSMVDFLTWRYCLGSSANSGAESSLNAQCNTADLKKICLAHGGSCVTSVDGYYAMTVVCTVLGILWLKWRSGSLVELQSLPDKAWIIERSSTSVTRNPESLIRNLGKSGRGERDVCQGSGDHV